MLFRVIELIILLIVLYNCDATDLREHARPTNDTEELPQYDIYQDISVIKGTAETITVGETTVKIEEDTLLENVQVRLGRLKNQPTRQVIAEVGDAKSDVVEITIYKKEDRNILIVFVLWS